LPSGAPAARPWGDRAPRPRPAGAPTDLTAVDRRPSARAAHADRNARRAFPGAALRSESPLRNAWRIRARLLLAHLRTDPVVGVAHSERMAAAARGARLLVLEPGPVGWGTARWHGPRSPPCIGRREL
jgi:pimeloyl-ACP methyl ester carboxylesterase